MVTEMTLTFQSLRAPLRCPPLKISCSKRERLQSRHGHHLRLYEPPVEELAAGQPSEVPH